MSIRRVPPIRPDAHRAVDHSKGRLNHVLRAGLQKFPKTSESVYDMFNKLSVREKLVAQYEMQKLVERLKSEPPGPQMTIEFYAGTLADPRHERPIPLLFLPDWEGERFFEFGTGNVALMHRTSIDDPYPHRFSFLPEGFVLSDPPEWLKFNDTPNAFQSHDTQFLWVSQGENGSNFIPSRGPLLKLTNIGPDAIERTLEPEFDDAWRDFVSMEQKWQLREHRKGAGDGLNRDHGNYHTQPVAAMKIYLTMKLSPEEKARRVRGVLAHLKAMPEYNVLMEHPNPDATFATYGAERSQELMKKAIAEMTSQGYDNTLTTEGGTLDNGFSITYLVPDGVRALAQVEKAAAAALESIPDQKCQRVG